MSTTSHGRGQGGVSLIEALVAVAIMGFGMLGVMGMQSTLRASGDISRQRAEAVRLAQDAMEEWRGFSTLVSTTGRMSYADIVTSNEVLVQGTNATYTVQRRVALPAVGSTNTVTPEYRTLVIDVSWSDRTGQPMSVRLTSAVVGVEPEMAASLIAAANPDPLITPKGRHRGIPRAAVQLGGGTSGYVPPGQSGVGDRVAWVFSNISGEITLCTTSATISSELTTSGGTPVCGSNRALLVSGTVRYATNDPLPPNTDLTSADIADPAGPVFPSFGMNVVQSAPFTQTVACFLDSLNNAQVQYFCAVPITTAARAWTGALQLGAPLPVAAAGSMSATHFKVCRYVAAASYTGIGTPLLSQNFVIIKAGNGVSPYSCPLTGTPRSWAHQPS